MRLLVIPKLHPGVSVDELLRHRTAEIQAVWALYAQGVCREMYGRADAPGAAILMLECASVETARDALATLPLARLNLLDFDIYPLTPFTALQSLFQAPSPVAAS
ncbi:MAG: superoxide dismutase [Ktedonobacterales bacterium]